MPGKSSDDDDVYDELLALAEPRKKRQASSSKGGGASKRRKQEAAVDSDEEPESEEDESNPYPLEGTYKDEYDRQRLMELPEIEREGIIAQRHEERQRLKDKLNVNRLFKASAAGDKEKDGIAKTVKRKHTGTGQTKEKAQGLAALTEQRRVKKERASKRANKAGSASPVRRRTATPSEESSDEEGQINKAEQEEIEHAAKAKAKEDAPTIEDINTVLLTRDVLAKVCVMPWFEEYVKGAFVRFLIGPDNHNQPAYRLCEVVNVGPETPRIYNINNENTNQMLELKHGKSQRCFAMDKVSNSPLDQHEFDRWAKTCEAEGIKLPPRSKLEKKKQQLDKFNNHRLTESDIAAMVARRAQLQPNKPNLQHVVGEKARLTQMRSLAIARKDVKEAADLTKALQELYEKHRDMLGEMQEALPPSDNLAAKEEKARKLKLEAKRKEEAEREKKKLVERYPSRSGTPNKPANVDPSARVKLIPRLRHDDPLSRQATPLHGTPPLKPQDPKTAVPSIPSSDKPPPSTFELMVNSVEVDLGDF